MTEAEQRERFHAALVAFEIRFEQDLAEPWERLETKAYFEIVGSPITKKYQPFHRFFEDVRVEVAQVIHVHFPSLLELAIANQQSDCEPDHRHSDVFRT